MGNLSYQEKVTGVIFGFLRTVADLSDKFDPAEMIFCWDSTKSWRKILYPDYKGNRNRDYTPEELRDRETAYAQFNELRDDILSRIGFANVFYQNGIEADDIIARVVIDQPLGNEYVQHIIVSSDNDLFQMLGLADMYFIDKKALFTKKDFIDKYDIHPGDWLKVKALVGDSSDNIPGIKGVGVKTAIKYLNGKVRGMNLVNTVQENIDQVNLNEILMRVPHPKTESVTINKSKIDMFQFEQVCMENGFQFFLKKEQYSKWLRMFQ
jgi:DNA polymerase-1